MEQAHDIVDTFFYPLIFSCSYMKKRVHGLERNMQSSDAKASFKQAMDKSYGGVLAELKYFLTLLANSKDEDEIRASLVQRRKNALLPILDSTSMNWSAIDKEKVEALNAFQHRHESEMGHFVVEAMRPDHMHDAKELLVDWEFTELIGWLLTDRPLLTYLVKEYFLAITVKGYVEERYAALPQSVTLVGLYGSDSVVAGTVELQFPTAGDPDVPTPDLAFICNLVIKKEYRRRGLGRQMLKAAEDLALSMGCEDKVPLTMYKEAGYQVVSTDSLLSVLTFQRRSHLMCKRLS